MRDELNISIIIPMFNEEENVEALLNEIYSTMDASITYEVIVVDDGSTDFTLQKLKAISHSRPLVIIHHAKNSGQSTALVSGAKKAQYRWLVTLDGDGQNNPADIIKLYKLCQAKLDLAQPFVILGNRVKRHDTWFRRVSSRIANTVRGWLLNDNCNDTGCSLKMFPTQLFLSIPHFNHVHRFLPTLFKRQGALIFNVEVDHRPRMKGVSKYGLHNRLWVGIIDLFGVFWLSKRPCNPEVNGELPK